MNYDAKIVVMIEDKMVASFGLGFLNSDNAKVSHLGREIANIGRELSYAPTVDKEELMEIYGHNDLEYFYDSPNELALKLVVALKGKMELGMMYFCPRDAKATFTYAFEVNSDGQLDVCIKNKSKEVFKGDWFEWLSEMENEFGAFFTWNPRKEAY